MKKVVVGLSGGVDSSVAALLLKEQGLKVVGVTMLTWEPQPSAQKREIPSKNTDESVEGSPDFLSDAKKVADFLDIPHITMDFRNEFKCRVVDYFMEEYLAGRTPNPCIACNRNVKWNALLKAAEDCGADYIATGHYANINKINNERYSIKASDDLNKDQSYALFGLSQYQLEKTLMPLGSYNKDDVRDIANSHNLPVAKKPDSQDICFIPDGDHGSFIKSHSERPVPGEGDFVDDKGNVLGRHKGIIHYTIGQRKGLNISAGHRVFVSKIDAKSNSITLSHSDIYSNKLSFGDINYMGVKSIVDGERFFAKIRYNHRGQWCRAYKNPDSRESYICEFEEPARAISPGQAVVLYKDGYIAAGGIIE